GTVVYGKLTCPFCSASEALIAVSTRTKAGPDWRLFALETVPNTTEKRKFTMVERSFQAASSFDRERFRAATRALHRRIASPSGWRFIPGRTIPRQGRSDNRLLHYGYG